MISVTVAKLFKRFGSVVALRHLDLTVEPGELFFLLGPSGCGKTTLLRCLAGFHIPEEGEIRMGGEDVTRLPAHRRNTGMMFQSYALWPHLTVAENVAFGLEERRVPKAEIRARVGAALEAVRLGDMGGRSPNELSGGQQQRVALARALVVRPRCLLLDEPLSNLDARLRLEMRAEIRRVCKESGLTAIYVTHDQKEALSIADRMAVLDAGRVLQVGAPREIYRRPVDRVVAAFIGESNFIEGEIVAAQGVRATVDTRLGRFAGVLTRLAGEAPQRGTKVTLSIRPEALQLDAAIVGDNNRIVGSIVEATYLGEAAQYGFAVGGQVLKALEVNPRHMRGCGSGEVAASVDSEDVAVLLS